MIATDLQNTFTDNHIELTLFPTLVLTKNPVTKYKLSFHWMIWKFSVIYDNDPKKDE